MPKKKEKTKEERISEELDRLYQRFEDIDANKKVVLVPLIQNAAFMKVSLEDLQEIINRDGVTETYQNGANQYGVKQSAAVQSYNALIKNYAAVIKQLSGYVPYVREPSEAELYLKAWQLSTNARKEGMQSFQDFTADLRQQKRSLESAADQ